MKSSYRLLFEYLFCLWLQYWFWDFMACITHSQKRMVLDIYLYLQLVITSSDFIRHLTSSWLSFFFFLTYCWKSFLFFLFHYFLFRTLVSDATHFLYRYLSPSSDMINNWLSAMKLKLLSPVPPVLDVLYVRIK